MVADKLILVLGCLLHTHSAVAIWTCSQDSDCTSLSGSVCADGACVCPVGTQAVLGGTACVEVAPYYWSPCIEDFQCSRLFTSFECRKPADSTTQVGNCFCQAGSHYFRGRCWPSNTLGESCSRDEECQGGLNDPFSMSCQEGSCQCAEGYYFRQRGECRRKALAVGDNCVIDEDCQFEGGACGLITLQCFNENAPASDTRLISSETSASSNRSIEGPHTYNTLTQYGEVCPVNGCVDPLVCSQGICVCPLGYYPNADASICLAELGSPVTAEAQCVGFFTEIKDGVCTCQANFYFGEDMRTCVKAVRLLSDSCMMDANCHTFGAYSRCGEPQQWGIRNCECDLEETVWDADRSICRLFAGVGEVCEQDSDCLAGDLEIQCVQDDQGQGICTCPPEYVAQGGLCLTLGLELGDTCQVSAECTGTPNSVCKDQQCACGEGYQQVNDFCAPSIGGGCSLDADCVIANTVCSAGTCQCESSFVEYQSTCWPASSGFGAPCNVTAQCAGVLVGTECINSECQCGTTSHFRDNGCWPKTGLFEPCARNSECYLTDDSERVECRNSLCQCSFDFPYSEALGTCTSSASAIFGSTIITIVALLYVFIS